MKKFLGIILSVLTIFIVTSCATSTENGTLKYRDINFTTTHKNPLGLIEGTDFNASEWNVAMVTDYGTISDQSFNQFSWKAIEEFCEQYSIVYKYYQPLADNTASRTSSVRDAIENGANIIVLPGFSFGEIVYEMAEDYPNVKFFSLDVSQADFEQVILPGEEWTLPANAFSVIYEEEYAGYMAGYAAVMEGYRHLGFLGGMEMPAVIRFGYGYVQGASQAANELEVEIKMEYVYGGTFTANDAVKVRMETWFSAGVEVVFACGGGIYNSVLDAAQNYPGKRIIGVDVDQFEAIDGDKTRPWTTGMTLTSAVKGLQPTILAVLAEIVTGHWDKLAGGISTLGLVSEDPELNYLQLPTATWAMQTFKLDDYKELVRKLFKNELTVSGDITTRPDVHSELVTVNYTGSIL